MQTKNRVPISLLVFTAVYFVASSCSALLDGSRELAIYVCTMAVLIALIFAVHRRYHLPTSLLWCFSIWGLFHMVGGLVRIPDFEMFEGQSGVVYSLWLVPNGIQYDQVVHAYGFGITTWMCWEVLRGEVKRRHGHELIPTAGVVVLCWAGGMGFGAFNEVVEFIATLTLPETNVGGYKNTGWDLVYNTVGALTVSMAIYLRGRRRRE